MTKATVSQKRTADEVLGRLRRAVTDGEAWFIALLQAIAEWPLPEETVGERSYRYLVGGEAFDWLLLAERLCEALDGLVPTEEQEALLFFGRPPLDVTEDEFRRLIGYAKYRAHLNYLYGVIVEEMLHLEVEDRLRKDQQSRVWEKHTSPDAEAFQHIYGHGQQELLREFQHERRLPETEDLSLGEAKEFTYWLFKRRLRWCEPARVASDTRRALAKLRSLEGNRSPFLGSTFLQEPPQSIETP
jgi:hypothetical protein